MGSDVLDEQHWARTPAGNVILRLIEKWDAGVTEHGDIALSFISTLGNDPAIASGAPARAQFICTREDARAIAQMLLRTLAYSEAVQASDFAAFRSRIRSKALRALADDWNAARGKRRMPTWKDISPDLTSLYLSGMWGFDRDPASGEFIGRLAGRTIMQGYRKNVLGTPLRDLYPPQAYETAHAGFTRILAQPACCLCSGKLFRVGDKVVEGERLILPIGADPEHPDGVLGASWYENYSGGHVTAHMEPLTDRTDWCQV